MLVIGPGPHFFIRQVVQMPKQFRSYNRREVARPSTNHRVQVGNERRLIGPFVALDDGSERLKMALDCCLTWGNDGFEPKEFSVGIPRGMRFAYGKLPDVESQEIKP